MVFVVMLIVLMRVHANQISTMLIVMLLMPVLVLMQARRCVGIQMQAVLAHFALQRRLISDHRGGRVLKRRVNGGRKHAECDRGDNNKEMFGLKPRRGRYGCRGDF
jgi:hypothetical protein